jgi:hypothetical protein
VDRLEDLDFADDLCLSEANGEMQMKLGDLIKEAEKVGLVINTKKTKALRVNTDRTEPFVLGDESIEMWKVLYTWVARSPKTERPHRTSHKESKKQMVLLYNFTQYGEIAKYPLGLNSASFIVM